MLFRHLNPHFGIFRDGSDPAGGSTPPATPPPAAPSATPAATPPAPAPAPAPAPSSTPAPASDKPDPLAEMSAKVAAMEKQLQEQTRARVVAEMGINPTAAKYITATDEAGMRAQAQEIKSFAPITPPADGQPAAPKAGTVTQPPGGQQQPTLQEKIAAAEKSGNKVASIGLKLQLLRGES